MSWLLHLCLVWALHYTRGQFRLPGDVIPTHYNLKLLFDLDEISNFSFYGVVDILLQAVKPTSRIVLNCRGIHFLDNDLKVIAHTAAADTAGRDKAKPAEIGVESAMMDNDNELYTLQFEGNLELNVVYTLSIAFFGNLTMDQEPGVYNSSAYEPWKNPVYPSPGYDSISIPQKYTVRTRFEPTGARRLFPCFDEPEYKATFSLIIGHHKEYIALSNTPIMMSTLDESLEAYFPWTEIERKFWKKRDNFMWDHFEKTATISTYLVGFVVASFKNVSQAGHPVTKVAVWTTSDVADYAKNVAPIALSILSYYEDYFNMPCELRKIDHVFHYNYEVASSANWGLINYAEVLLHEDKNMMFLERIALTQAMSKGMALQWLGNTIKWWNDQWLKEGLATHLSHVSLSTLLAKDNITEAALVLSPFMEILEENALESTSAIKSPMEMTNPRVINDYSKRLQHNKAALLFRMLYKVTGDDIFKDALHNFLVNHAYRSTSPDELWEEMYNWPFNLGSVTRNITQKMVMDSWLTQPGYPLINITRDYYNNSLSLTQRRYISQDDVSVSTLQGWWVPIRLATAGGRRAAATLDWVADNDGVVNSFAYNHGADESSWIVFNVDMIAPCRVNYDSRNWELLAEAMKMPENRTLIPPLSRAQLLADAYELAKNGLVEYSFVFKLTSYLVSEVDPDVLENGLQQLASIGIMIKRTPQYEAYEKLVNYIVMKNVIQDESDLLLCLYMSDQAKGLLRYQDFKLCVVLCKWGSHVDSTKYSEILMKLFYEWNPQTNRRAHLERLILCYGVSHEGKDGWDNMYYRSSYPGIADKTNIFNALACTREPWLLHRTFEKLINGELPSAPNVAVVIKTAMHNPVGYYVGKEFIYKKSKDIFTGYSAQTTMLALITHLLDQVSEQQDLVEFAAWRSDNFNSLVKLGINTSVTSAYEAARRNVAWMSSKRQVMLDQLTMISTALDLEIHHRMKLKRANKSNKIAGGKLCCFLSYVFYVFIWTNYMIY